jgi:hypothetical protein
MFFMLLSLLSDQKSKNKSTLVLVSGITFVPPKSDVILLYDEEFLAIIDKEKGRRNSSFSLFFFLNLLNLDMSGYKR